MQLGRENLCAAKNTGDGRKERYDKEKSVDYFCADTWSVNFPDQNFADNFWNLFVFIEMFTELREIPELPQGSVFYRNKKDAV